jgi:phospholipase A1
VKLAVFLATPHAGAPLAFARAIGVGGSSLGVSQADLKVLSDDPRYPAAYQLFPQEHLETIWQLRGTPAFASQSVFDPSLVRPFSLSTSGLAAARELQAELNVAKKPAACRYFAVVGESHETVSRFDRDANTIGPVTVKGTGDGTVPVLSASALPIQTGFVVADHIGVTQSYVTHKLLGVLLGRVPPGPIPAFAAARGLALSIANRFVPVGDDVEVIIAATNVDQIDAVVRISRVTGGQSLMEIPTKAEAKGLARIELRTPHLDEPGNYKLELVVGDEVVDSKELLVTA